VQAAQKTANNRARGLLAFTAVQAAQK